MEETTGPWEGWEEREAMSGRCSPTEEGEERRYASTKEVGRGIITDWIEWRLKRGYHAEKRQFSLSRIRIERGERVVQVVDDEDWDGDEKTVVGDLFVECEPEVVIGF